MSGIRSGVNNQSVAPFSSTNSNSLSSRDTGDVVTASVSDSRWSPHFADDACGSVSIKATVCPFCSASTDRLVASVVLPGSAFLADDTQNLQCHRFVSCDVMTS